jgi:hypothetical protein
VVARVAQHEPRVLGIADGGGDGALEVGGPQERQGRDVHGVVGLLVLPEGLDRQEPVREAGARRLRHANVDLVLAAERLLGTPVSAEAKMHVRALQPEVLHGAPGEPAHRLAHLVVGRRRGAARRHVRVAELLDRHGQGGVGRDVQPVDALHLRGVELAVDAHHLDAVRAAVHVHARRERLAVGRVGQPDLELRSDLDGRGAGAHRESRAFARRGSDSQTR